MKWKSRRSARTTTSVETAFQARVLLLHETAVHFLFRQGFLVEPAVVDDSVDVVEPFQDLVGQEQGVQGGGNRQIVALQPKPQSTEDMSVAVC